MNVVPKRPRRARSILTLVLASQLALVAAGERPARAYDPLPDAQTPPSAPHEDAATVHARELFAQAASLSKRMQWAEALAAFEEVARLHPHPVVTMNIAICERALGRYTRARAMFTAFLEEAHAHDAEPPPPGKPSPPRAPVPDNLVQDARTYVREIEALLVHLDVTVKPAGVRIAVDGRPLSIDVSTTPPRRVAGLAPPGAGASVSVASFELIVDPGAHLFLASRAGHSDVLVNRSFTPGMHAELGLELEKLQAHLVVDSTIPRARVVLDGRDVGLTPLDLARPAGRYVLEVDAKGHDPYTTKVLLEPGQTSTTNARLVPTSYPLPTRWWFWASAAAVVAGGVLLTYAVTRPTPSPPPYDAGGSGWLAVVK